MLKNANTEAAREGGLPPVSPSRPIAFAVSDDTIVLKSALWGLLACVTTVAAVLSGAI
jgi:hypothetical protein